MPNDVITKPRDSLIERECTLEEKKMGNKRCFKFNVSVFELNVYPTPEVKKLPIGKIKIEVNPELGINAIIMNSKGKTEPFECQCINKSDWGYSHFFEFAVKSFKEEWIELPGTSIFSSIWINPTLDWGKENAPKPSELEEDIYLTHKGSIVVLKFEGKDIIYRKENGTDFNCNDEVVKKPTKEELRIKREPIKNFYDSHGKINLVYSYPKGC